MFDIENRTPLPLASSAGCSCCSPAGRAPKTPAAVVLPAPTPDHLPR